jgi:hypothetical protein
MSSDTLPFFMEVRSPLVARAVFAVSSDAGGADQEVKQSEWFASVRNPTRMVAWARGGRPLPFPFAAWITAWCRPVHLMGVSWTRVYS